VALALLLEARRRQIPVRAFKKGPDYIDAAWLTWASGAPARNLDTYLMGFQRAADSFLCNALHSGLNLIEGNRGLYDGVDAQGLHSTAELAKALNAPVILVIDGTKMTRTAAALVLGCQTLDPSVWLAGVILNQVSGKRHENVMRDAIVPACGVPVLGVIPRATAGTLLPTRHLGLVTPAEHPNAGALAESLAQLVGGRVDLDRITEIASRAPRLTTPPLECRHSDDEAVNIGFLSDSAFTFYYPENLDALRAGGAALTPVSALSSVALPEELDALYIGGGFPETHARALAANTSLLRSLRHAAREGMPIYAECGGLMLLSRAIRWLGDTYAMASVLPFDVEVCAAPQGHGYVELLVDSPNPFFPSGTRIRGHEFHYSRIRLDGNPLPTACAVLRGTGGYDRRDGVLVDNVWASYTHVHALGTPEWARGVLAAARRFVRTRV
jgi:cobyrinic acid a,c-diamide synthase